MIAVEAWLPADGLTLEPNALRAVKERECCLALTAGPGAGKTEMLAQRADFLLRTGTCRYPKRILAISFKVDASRNLKERIQRRCGSDLASRFDSYTFHAFAKRIIDRFRPVLVDQDALDADYTIVDRKSGPSRTQIEFGDLVPLAIKILQGSRMAQNAIRQTYSDVFLDEFQDCTNLQYDLVKLAFQGTRLRLTAVGDTKQKIMGWAGALDGIFGTFVSDFNAEPLNMYRNFRSKPRLLRVQNDIIRQLDPASVMPDELLEGDEGEVYTHHFTDSREEAVCLANLIHDWIEVERIPPAEIAILVSKQLDLYADHLMAELEVRGIPYRNEQQMQDITVEPAARLIVDYLSCLYGHREPKAWVRLMNQLIPFADEEIQSSARKELDCLIKKQRKEADIAELIDSRFSDWRDCVSAFLAHIGSETLMALSPDYESRTRLREVVRDTKARIEELLQIESDLPKALERFVDDQAVRILTIHKSKGLEFDSVIIMAVENEIFFGSQDENRCAFFVGVSRAKRRLILTHADQRERPANAKRWNVSRTAQAEYISYVTPFVRPQ
ncbi:ATP-dependent helicase [Enterobacter roggenkampii]|uniref:DNA 3'-5' helicase n=1 Tax=Enterobacter roggenkampii TaxID=1812935 RepID=A0ABD7GSN6_9ENTR|nr:MULTISPECIES: ATP-dependent helicase [Enterobacteriaceae]EIY4985504.1 ATP-dependent helicase [Klebsiella quasipneumoniae]HEO9243306.1 ATP-dependent helicase [Enterobacter ludwigii]RDT13926.1 ATP-dependent helicase [Enterobacter roggenkampii]RDT19592.1 ATP-dependent helicase [Enterobacter roggenkampii]RDT37379.1 ATP-dependent helicase [Enterobacter roggenkampii]